MIGAHHDVFDQTSASPQEILQIHQMKKNLGDKMGAPPATPELDSESGHLRFIRGYTGDVSAACEAYLAGLAWRTANGATMQLRDTLKIPDEALSEEEVFQLYADLSRLPHWQKVGASYPERFFHRRDENGNPIMITTNDMISSICNLLTVVSKTEYDEFRVARMVNLELMLEALTRKSGRLIKCVYIWDLKGLSYSLYSQWQISCVKTFSSDFDEKAAVAFPETALRIVAVNVPGWLNALWVVFKRVIPARTLRKILVVGTSGVSEALVKNARIPPTSIPASLGGSCPAQETLRMFTRPKGFEISTGSLEIGAGAVKFVDVPHGPNVIIMWGILITNRDVVLSVELVSVAPTGNAERIQELFVPTRIDSAVFPRGIASPAKEGAIRLVLDNTRSLIMPKTIVWSVAIKRG